MGKFCQWIGLGSHLIGIAKIWAGDFNAVESIQKKGRRKIRAEIVRIKYTIEVLIALFLDNEALPLTVISAIFLLISLGHYRIPIRMKI